MYMPLNRFQRVLTVKQPTEVGRAPENIKKNRFKNITACKYNYIICTKTFIKLVPDIG